MRGDSGGTGCVEEYGDSATAWSKYDIEVIKSEALWLRNISSVAQIIFHRRNKRFLRGILFLRGVGVMRQS
ncbi:MAG: hypothetical protein DME93_08455 [Verrucomicrobia bacterium]|nr:MAG: hypothetical protein DME93_08455 [Verrucomicrobiota bacterium]